MDDLPPGIFQHRQKFRARLRRAQKTINGPARPTVAEALQDLAALRANKPLKILPKRSLPKYVYQTQWHGQSFHRAQRTIARVGVNGRDGCRDFQVSPVGTLLPASIPRAPAPPRRKRHYRLDRLTHLGVASVEHLVHRDSVLRVTFQSSQDLSVAPWSRRPRTPHSSRRRPICPTCKPRLADYGNNKRTSTGVPGGTATRRTPSNHGSQKEGPGPPILRCTL